MKEIHITKGTGTGPTPLSAFDSALYSAGIANYNLIHLSSVIPPNHVPVLKQAEHNDDVATYGDRMYLVYASNATVEVGASVYAGLGWVMTEEEPKRGLFVEHVGATEGAVQKQIEDTLGSMTLYRKETYGKVHSAIAGTTCTNKPVCVIVAALYENEGWKGE